MNRRLIASILVWTEAIALIGVGVGLLVARTISVESREAGSTDTYTITLLDVSVIGLTLLTAGLLILAALLIIAANRGERSSKPPELSEAV